VDGEKPQRSALALSSARPAAETPESVAARHALTRLLRKRLKKFMALVPQVSPAAAPKTVHDARVWSRRLQQAMNALFPKPRAGKVRRLRRMPRRMRRALGEWRNADVLLEMVTKQQRRTRSDAKRQAWAWVSEYLQQKRSKEIARAERKLRRVNLENYASLVQGLLVQPCEDPPEVLVERLRGSARRAWSKWQSALSAARITRAPEDLHGLRIATKDLRYRTELLYELGIMQEKARLKWLATLQEALGVWHDRQVFDHAVAEALARPEFLLATLPAARILMAELAAHQGRQSSDVEKIFRLAEESPGNPETKSAGDKRLAPQILGLTPAETGSGVKGKEVKDE
jgi:CHAD domain-containing protein